MHLPAGKVHPAIEPFFPVTELAKTDLADCVMRDEAIAFPFKDRAHAIRDAWILHTILPELVFLQRPLQTAALYDGDPLGIQITEHIEWLLLKDNEFLLECGYCEVAVHDRGILPIAAQYHIGLLLLNHLHGIVPVHQCQFQVAMQPIDKFNHKLNVIATRNGSFVEI